MKWLEIYFSILYWSIINVSCTYIVKWKQYLAVFFLNYITAAVANSNMFHKNPKEKQCIWFGKNSTKKNYICIWVSSFFGLLLSLKNLAQGPFKIQFCIIKSTIDNKRHAFSLWNFHLTDRDRPITVNILLCYMVHYVTIYTFWVLMLIPKEFYGSGYL